MALLRILFPVAIVVTSVVLAVIRGTMAGAGGSALIIVDVQNCFTSGGRLAVPDGDAVVPVINRLRSEYAQYFDVVVLSQDWHCSDHVSFASQHPGCHNFDRINLTYLSTGQSVPLNYCSDRPISVRAGVFNGEGNRATTPRINASMSSQNVPNSVLKADFNIRQREFIRRFDLLHSKMPR